MPRWTESLRAAAAVGAAAGRYRAPPSRKAAVAVRVAVAEGSPARAAARAAALVSVMVAEATVEAAAAAAATEAVAEVATAGLVVVDTKVEAEVASGCRGFGNGCGFGARWAAVGREGH